MSNEELNPALRQTDVSSSALSEINKEAPKELYVNDGCLKWHITFSRLCAGGALKHESFNPPINLIKCRK